jgi:LuxR family maltose regulon positive regulatory protein
MKSSLQERPAVSPDPPGNARVRRVLVDTSRGSLPFDVVESKIRVPTVRRGMVSRPALVNRLRARTDARVATIVAPAGYGKTTLLTQWAARDDRPFIWLSADDRDNDPVVLLRHIAAAVDLIEPLADPVLDALSVLGPSIWTAAIPRLGAALEALETPVVLVVDDGHLVRDRDAADAIFALAEHLPPGSLLAVAARVTPALPIPSLRADGRLLELGVDGLALTRREAELLFRQAGIELSAHDLDVLVARTEGWAAALSLAALALGTSAKPQEVAAFNGEDRFVADYLETEYLARLSGDDLDFLQRTAVLDRFSGELCDWVLESSGSGARLAEVERSNLFLVPLDRHREWYRYHRLFRDLLRRELAQRDPNLARELHRRAAAWFEANGDPESALEHALEAGETDTVARLLTELALPAYYSGRAATIDRWLQHFDDPALLERYPAVAVHGARIHALCGRDQDAARWLEAAESATSLDTPESRSIRPCVSVLRATLCRHGAEQMLVDARDGASGLDLRDPWRPAASLLVGVSLMLLGEVGESDRAFAEAASLAQGHGFVETHVTALSERSILAAANGDLDAAERFAIDAARVSGVDGADGFPSAALGLAVHARTLLRQGRWDEARAELAKAQRLTSSLTDAMPWLAIQTRLELGQAYVTLRDAGAAQSLVGEIADHLERHLDLGILVDQADALRAAAAAMPASQPGKAAGLTGAELRLLPMLATHLSFREIGERLYVSRNTIKTQAISVYRKLGVSARSAAVDRAAELGLIEGATSGDG